MIGFSVQGLGYGLGFKDLGLDLLEGGDALQSAYLVVGEDESVDLLERLQPRHGLDHVVVGNERLHSPDLT